MAKPADIRGTSSPENRIPTPAPAVATPDPRARCEGWNQNAASDMAPMKAAPLPRPVTK